jgi:acetyl esterase
VRSTRRALIEIFERGALRGLLALPEQVQRMLAGPPVVIDGQTLSAETQLVLRARRLTRPTPVEKLPIRRARKELRYQQRLAGEGVPIGSVADVEVAGRPARLYRPTGAEEVSPLLVFFHGGGWIYGDLDSHDAACRFLAEQSGVRVLSVDYRLAPEHPYPAAYEDCLAAYEWVTQHPGELGADPTRLAVGGDSAGGTLAATVALTAARRGLPLAFQLLIYPGTDMRGGTRSRELFGRDLVLTDEFIELARSQYVPEPAQWEHPLVSPLLADVPADLAPAYIATAGFDPLRDEGEAYARKLAEAGVPVEVSRFTGQIHGFLHFVAVGRSALAANREIARRLRAGLA